MQTFEWHSKQLNVCYLAFYFKMHWIFLVWSVRFLTHRDTQAQLISTYLSLSVRDNILFIFGWILTIYWLRMGKSILNYQTLKVLITSGTWILNSKRLHGCWLQDTILIDIKILALHSNAFYVKWKMIIIVKWRATLHSTELCWARATR